MSILFSILLSLSLHAESISNMTVFGKMDKYPQAGYSAIWGYTAPDGREYALLGVQTGTSIVDITEQPIKEIAFIPGPNSMWRELHRHSFYTI